MNLAAEDLASGVLRDRGKVGASLADVDPMNLDNTVSGVIAAAKQAHFIFFSNCFGHTVAASLRVDDLL